jgi:hypothetical protein
MLHSSCHRVFIRVAVMAIVTALPVLWSATSGASCKANGQQCSTNMSCCNRQCVKPTLKRGAALFGVCCTPSTCRAAGANCGTIPNGDCAGFTLDCGTCTAPATCGGGGTPNVCGTSTTTTSTTTSSSTTTTTIVCLPDGTQGCQAVQECCSGACDTTTGTCGCVATGDTGCLNDGDCCQGICLVTGPPGSAGTCENPIVEIGCLCCSDPQTCQFLCVSNLESQCRDFADTICNNVCASQNANLYLGHAYCCLNPGMCSINDDCLDPSKL